MLEHDLSNREEQTLQCIHRCITENGEPPTALLLADFMLPYFVGSDINTVTDTKWLERQRKSVHRNVLTVVGRLIKKAYVERKGNRIFLTAKAYDYYGSIYETVHAVSANAFLPARIKIRGYVTAGRTNTNDLDINLPDDDLDTIAIPNARPDRTTYALRVEGRSMEHEGIFPGDYIILEEFQASEWPKNGEMIVTRYSDLPFNANYSDIDVEISGHTLKIYQEVHENGKRYYRLSWRKDHLSNPHLIKATHLQPVGRVIGVYRSYRK